VAICFVDLRHLCPILGTDATVGSGFEVVVDIFNSVLVVLVDRRKDGGFGWRVYPCEAWFTVVMESLNRMSVIDLEDMPNIFELVSACC